MTTTYVFGDIHGMYHALVTMLGMVSKDAREHGLKKWNYVFLGDFVDRGPQSKQVVQLLIDLKKVLPEGAITFLKGNHEDMLIKAYEAMNDRYSSEAYHFLGNGGHATMQSYGLDSGDFLNIPKDHMNFYYDLATSAEDNRRFYVHAGIHPWKPLDQQPEEMMLWIREPFLEYNDPFPKHIVHGHTPYGVEQKHNRTNLDSGAVFGKSLSVGVFDDTQDGPLRILSLPTPKRLMIPIGDHPDFK